MMGIDNNVYEIYPSYFDTRNPNYMIFDNKYVSGLIVINYNKEMEKTFLEKLLSLEIDLQLSVFYEKQNTAEMVKKLTYHIR